jgi:hypothetical protein
MIPKFTANYIVLKGFLADSRKIKGLPCVLISLTSPSSALSHWLLLNYSNYFVNSAIINWWEVGDVNAQSVQSIINQQCSINSVNQLSISSVPIFSVSVHRSSYVVARLLNVTLVSLIILFSHPNMHCNIHLPNFILFFESATKKVW